MGSVATRTIGGRRYTYYVYYDGGERKEVYCGAHGDGATAENLRRAELEDLASQKRRIASRMRELRG